jgi:hypothetical protein
VTASVRSLADQLGIEPGMTVGVLNAPNYYDIDLDDVPDDVEVHRGDDSADIYLIFADRTDEAERGLQRAVTTLPPDGSIWIAWAENSDEAEDISPASLRDIGAQAGLVEAGTCALDDTWSALRLVVPEKDRSNWTGQEWNPEEADSDPSR